MNWQLSDLLRVLATTLVIGIHASHRWWFGVDGARELNIEIFGATAINQLGRFAVPLFVVLSGFSLGLAEQSRPFNWLEFGRRRLGRILPPLIFFSLSGLAGRSPFQVASLPDKTVQFFQALFQGSADYHLYFLVIILQCYLAYPILRLWQFSPGRLGLLLAGAIAGLLIYWEASRLGWFPGLLFWLPNGDSVIFWLPYFLLGIWLAKDQNWIMNQVGRFSSRAWAGVVAIAAILELSEFYWAVLQTGSAEAVGHYARPTVFLLTLAVLGWVLTWQKLLGSEPIKNRVANLAKASFTTYLTHVYVLRLIEPLTGWGGFFYMLLAAIASWAAGYLIWFLVKPIPGIKALFGA